MAFVEERMSGKRDWFGHPVRRFRARWHDVSGKLRSKTFDSHDEALEYALRMKRRVAAEERERVDHEVADVSLDDFLDSWLDRRRLDVEAGNISSRTFEGYESIARNHLRPRLGGRKVRRITVEDVERMLTEVLAEGLSSTTANNVRRTLSVALRWGERQDWLTRNVAALAEPRKDRRPDLPPSHFSEAELRALAGAGGEVRNGWAVPFACFTGLRVSEVAGLRWGDVDLVEGTMRVERAMKRGSEDGTRFGPTKTRATSGDRSLSDEAVECLLRQQAAQDIDRSMASRWTESDAVFYSTTGTHADTKSLWKTIKALMEAAGVSERRTDGKGGRGFHEARRTFATRLIGAGLSTAVVARAGGWASTQVLDAAYGGSNDEMLRGAVNAPPSVL